MKGMGLDVGLLFLRVTVGLMLMGHGLGKMMDLFHGKTQFPDPLGIGSLPTLILAVLAELVCAGLVVAGLKVRIAAIPPAVAMLVAAFLLHASDPWEKKEFVLLYAIPFLTLIMTGGGRFTIDSIFKGGRRS